MKESTFQGVGGLKIATRSWQPAGKARAVMILIHGFNSHSGYYSWVAEQFVANGLAAYALDLRGRGKSEGERFYVEKFEDYVNDVHTFVKIAKSEQPNLPTYLLAHSAGGVVGCVYALEHQAELSGFICEDFAHEVPAPDFALAVFKGLSHVAPHAHSFSLKNEDFSRDPKAVELMNNDPLIAHESQPVETMAEMVRADERLKKEFPLITLPVLIMHGSADKVTKPSGSRHFYEKAGSKDKTLKIYEGHYHDLLADIGKEEVLGDIQRWIDDHISTP